MTHTHALFAEQSQSILDDLAALSVESLGSVAVIWGGYISIDVLAPFCGRSFATRRMHGLESVCCVAVHAVTKEAAWSSRRLRVG